MKVILIYPNKFSLADLKQNNYDIENIKSNLDIFDFNHFNENIQSIIKIIDIENDQYFMDNLLSEMLYDHKLVNILKNTENLWGDSKLCLDFNDIRYDLIHIDSDLIKDHIDENHLGSLLTHEQIGIFGPCVLMATKFKEDTSIIKDCNLNDLFKILVNKMVMRGIMIKQDDIKNIFVSSQKKILNKVLLTDFIDYFATTINGFTYVCYYNSKNKEYLNIIGSIFFRRTLYGAIIVLMEDRNITIDFNMDIFEKSLLSNDIKFTENEKVCNYSSFLNSFKNKKQNISKCICGNLGDKFCSLCYNICYCSHECQSNDWNNHQNNCS